MIRTQAILELLQANISLLLVDADHFWARDPLPWLDEQVMIMMMRVMMMRKVIVITTMVDNGSGHDSQINTTFGQETHCLG